MDSVGDSDIPARVVMEAFNHYSIRIGEWLLEQNITAFAWNRGHTTLDVKIGLRFAIRCKRIEKAPTGVLVLRRDGLAAIRSWLNAPTGNACNDPATGDATPLNNEEMEIISRVYKAVGAEPWFAHSYADDWQFSALVMQAFVDGRRTEPHLLEHCTRVARDRYRISGQL